MSISTLDDILINLKEELEENLNSGGEEYLLKGVTVKRGVSSWSDTDGRRPYIWFTVTGESPISVMGSNTLTTISIELHGYTDTDGYGSADNMHKLLHDVKHFLHNDYSAKNNVEMVEDVLMNEGGIYDDLHQSGFMLPFIIRSSYSHDNI